MLKKTSKLKGTDIFVQNDYSKQTLAKRKLVWESAAADKDQGKKAFLAHDKLRVDNDLFIWNDVTNERQLIESRRTTTLLPQSIGSAPDNEMRIASVDQLRRSKLD